MPHDDLRQSAANYLCAANYQFSAPVERLRVDCTFYEVTVPNHIHMLHAERAGKSDQAILDSAFSTATLAFRPPTAGRTCCRAGRRRRLPCLDQLGAGPAPARHRARLAHAPRAHRLRLCVSLRPNRRNGPGILRTAWQPSPRFAEAAAALALAYLALEIIAFPQSRGRWLLALTLRLFRRDVLRRIS
jgi:hypothetical protein